MKSFNERFLQLKLEALESNLKLAKTSLEECHKILLSDILINDEIRFLVADHIHTVLEIMED